MDSGGFTELSKYGRWTVTPAEYADAARLYQADIGQLDWASPQDWMCEPWMLNGRTVATHQRLTVENYCTLRDLAPDVPFTPVIQGWTVGDYVRCCELYQQAGVDLRQVPLVGVGSVCRRQATDEIGEIFKVLAGEGLRLHGFGVKVRGLQRYGGYLDSCDSFAWSYNARRNPPLPGCTHPRCNYCPLWALRWRERLLNRLSEGGG